MKPVLVPLAFLRAHEKFVEARVLELVERFRKSGVVDYAIVADKESGTVVDGHHRFEALRRLGASLAPVILVDYRDAAITVRNWRPDEPSVTKEDILRHAREGKLYPPKTTRHDFVRILEPADVPLAQLVGAATAR